MTAGGQPSSADPGRAGAMSAALKALLDPVRGSRKVLTHVAALEADLLRHGLMVLGRVSTPTLLKLGKELATLPVAADNAPLQELQSLLLVELDSRTGRRRPYLSSFVSDDKLLVSEGSHTDFMNLVGPGDPAKPKT